MLFDPITFKDSNANFVQSFKSDVALYNGAARSTRSVVWSSFLSTFSCVTSCFFGLGGAMGSAAKVGPLDELEAAVETLEGGLAEIHATEVYSSTY